MTSAIPVINTILNIIFIYVYFFKGVLMLQCFSGVRHLIFLQVSAVSRIQLGKQRESSNKTLYSPILACLQGIAQWNSLLGFDMVPTRAKKLRSIKTNHKYSGLHRNDQKASPHSFQQIQLYLGARQCPRQVEQKKAAQPYHPFLEAIQALFDPL